MELDRFLNLVATSLATLGSVYVLKSYLRMTPTASAELATPRWGFSLSVLEFLSAQRAEAIVGTGAFVSALAVGIVGIAFASSAPLFDSRARGVLADICVTAVASAGADRLSRIIRRRSDRAARVVLLRKAYDEVVREGRGEQAYIDALAQTADALFGTSLNGSDASVVRSAVADILCIPRPAIGSSKLSSPRAS